MEDWFMRILVKMIGCGCSKRSKAAASIKRWTLMSGEGKFGRPFVLQMQSASKVQPVMQSRLGGCAT